MPKEYDVSKLDEMSLEEMEALEDEIHAEEVAGATDDTAVASQTVPDTAETKQDAETVKVEAESGDAGSEAESTPAKTVDADADAGTGEGTPDPELVKHVSPPSKWAAERAEKRELQARAEAAENAVTEADTLREELATLNSKMSFMEEAIKSKGIELPKTPLDTFSDEKITEIRDEFGDELADMFTATKAMLVSKEQPKPAAPAAAKTEADPAPQSTPAAEQASQDEGPDPALIEAIAQNDELSYWQENSPALWNRAVELDASLLKNQEYGNLPYKDRFAKVVEQVKSDVMKGATPPVKTGEGDKPPAETLSGVGGETPAPTGNTALDRVMAATDADAQLKVYNTLSQAEKDSVDMALNI